MIRWYPREEWGADKALPRLGRPVLPEERTEVVIHHTVVTDSDATPNVFESQDECFAQMRRLQTIRPDLGLDVPYNLVAFVVDTGFSRPCLLVCEGRGLMRSGAHTRGHNRSALGIAFQGNFELAPPECLDELLIELGEWLQWLKPSKPLHYSISFPNLFDSRPEDGRHCWGHRDFKATACPGKHLWDRLGLIKPKEEIRR